MPSRLSRSTEAFRKPPPKQARSAAKRTAILDATEKLLSDHAPAEITTRLIAEAGSVPIGSIYRYFANVDDLLLSLFERMNAGTIKALKDNKVGEERDWRDHLDLTFDHLRAMHGSHPAYGALMMHVDLGDRGEDEITQLLGALLHRSLPHLDPALVSEVTQTVIALLEGVERRLYRLPATQRPAALDQARIAVAAYLSHYLDTPL
ncbi:MAG: TetR/AcrR family transcriptional regulator [Litorimonas sp.]